MSMYVKSVVIGGLSPLVYCAIAQERPTSYSSTGQKREETGWHKPSVTECKTGNKAIIWFHVAEARFYTHRYLQKCSSLLPQTT